MRSCARVVRVSGVVAAWVAMVATSQWATPARAQTKTPQQATSAVFVRVTGEISNPLELTADDFARIKHQTVRAKAHDGVESEYSGVALIDLLARAGVPVGKELRGPAMALYLVVEASDGYRAAFALAELDPAFTDRVILLADVRDGKPLSPSEGPLRIVVPGEKKHARWVRQVKALKLGRG